jgi:hypothetical protein
MIEELTEISIDLGDIEEGLMLTINERSEHTLFLMDDAEEHGEAVYQIRERCFYDYEPGNPDSFLADPFNNIVRLVRKYNLLNGLILPGK